MHAEASKRTGSPLLEVLGFLVASALLALPAGAGTGTCRARKPATVEGELLVTCAAEATDTKCRGHLSAAGYAVANRLHSERAPAATLDRLYLVRIPEDRNLEQALDEMHRSPHVETAQPNYLYYPRQLPDDEYFSLQWGQENSGDDSAHTVWELRGPDPRVPGADISATEARAAYDGMSFDTVVVAIVDSGMDWSHPDLAGNVWTNPDELPGNGRDDDGNSYIDDVRGWDFKDDDNDPSDLNGIGTHVSGIVGALGFNGIGVAGTAPNVSLMPLRFFGPDGGSTYDAIDAIQYAVDQGALVINASWGGAPSASDPALEAAIEAAGNAGVLVVAAAGNDARDTDVDPHYPAAFDLDNIISVAASTPWGNVADFSNWGRISVDLAAPGEEIISTTPTAGDPGDPETPYQISHPSNYDGPIGWSGTSMSAPFVSAAAAILFGLGGELWPGTWPAMSPEERAAAVRSRILTRAERWPALSGTSVTDGHLDLYNLIEDDTTPPDPVGASLTPIATGTSHVTLHWMASGDDATSGRANYYDLRYAEAALFDWTTATPVTGVWTPSEAGSHDYFTVTGLDPSTAYAFGLEVVDNAGNRSGHTEVEATTRPASVVLSDELRFEDAFDANDCSNWQVAGAWGCESNTLSDSPGTDYAINNRASATTESPVGLEGANAVELSFDLAAFEYEDGYDFLFVKYSLDGSNWRELGRLTGSQSGMQTYDVSFLAGMPSVYFRFTSLSDYGTSKAGARIDNVRVTVQEPTTEPSPVPALSTADRLLLGLLLVTFGVAALRRRYGRRFRRRPDGELEARLQRTSD